MRWINEKWTNLNNKVVRLNSLSGVTPSGVRIGIVQGFTPMANGKFKMRVSFRERGIWTDNYFHGTPKEVEGTMDRVFPILTKEAQARVQRVFYRQNTAQLIKNINRGFTGSLGADPEIFAVTQNNRVLPAWEFLPEKAPENEVFWDGFQAEFTTATESCLAWFLDHVRTGLVRVNNAAKAKGGQLALTDVIEVPMEILEKAEQKHVQFGCDPSKNAYNDFGQIDVKPRELEIRFAGGHKHFGTHITEKQAIPIVKALDAIWGTISVSMFEGLESPLRRIYYGKAGEFRLPPHGLEYRTPSNAWLCHPAIAQLSWTLARQAYDIGQKDLLQSIWKVDENETRRVINELDVTAARKILNAHRKILETLLEGYFATNHSRIPETEFQTMRPWAVKQGLRVMLEGAINVLEAPKNLVRNWMLDAPTDEDRWYKPTTEEARKKDTVWHQHTETGNSQWMIAASAIERGERI